MTVLLKICPVCGFNDLEQTPYDEYGYPTYVICPCCGYEFGFDDSSKKISFLEYRRKWIEKGFRYFRKNLQPVIWDLTILEEQLKNVCKVNYKARL